MSSAGMLAHAARFLARSALFDDVFNMLVIGVPVYAADNEDVELVCKELNV